MFSQILHQLSGTDSCSSAPLKHAKILPVIIQAPGSDSQTVEWVWKIFWIPQGSCMAAHTHRGCASAAGLASPCTTPSLAGSRCLSLWEPWGQPWAQGPVAWVIPSLSSIPSQLSPACSAWDSHTDHHPSYTLLPTIAEKIPSMHRIHPNFPLFLSSNSKKPTWTVGSVCHAVVVFLPKGDRKKLF